MIIISHPCPSSPCLTRPPTINNVSTWHINKLTDYDYYILPLPQVTMLNKTPYDLSLWWLDGQRGIEKVHSVFYFIIIIIIIIIIYYYYYNYYYLLLLL